jgi:hypothetical protein
LAERRRLHLKKELSEKYGDHRVLVEVHDGIKLVPIADEPLDALREEFADVEKSAADLRRAGRGEAVDQAGR